NYGKQPLGENTGVLRNTPASMSAPDDRKCRFPPPAGQDDMSYPNTQLFINGEWQDAQDGKTLAVFNPATGKEIGRVAHASTADLDRALDSAQKGSEKWRDLQAI